MSYIIKCSRCGEPITVLPRIDVYDPLLEHVYTKHGFKPYIPKNKKSKREQLRASRYRTKLVKNFFVNDAVLA